MAAHSISRSATGPATRPSFTTDGAKVEYLGDQNTTFGSSGSGIFDSFVRLQADPQEKGYNTDGTLEYDTKGGAFTHSIKVSDIPVISVGGAPLGAVRGHQRQRQHDTQISLNEFEIYFTATRT